MIPNVVVPVVKVQKAREQQTRIYYTDEYTDISRDTVTCFIICWLILLSFHVCSVMSMWYGIECSIRIDVYFVVICSNYSCCMTCSLIASSVKMKKPLNDSICNILNKFWIVSIVQSIPSIVLLSLSRTYCRDGIPELIAWYYLFITFILSFPTGYMILVVPCDIVKDYLHTNTQRRHKPTVSSKRSLKYALQFFRMRNDDKINKSHAVFHLLQTGVRWKDGLFHPYEVLFLLEFCSKPYSVMMLSDNPVQHTKQTIDIHINHMSEKETKIITHNKSEHDSEDVSGDRIGYLSEDRSVYISEYRSSYISEDRSMYMSEYRRDNSSGYDDDVNDGQHDELYDDLGEESDELSNERSSIFNSTLKEPSNVIHIPVVQLPISIPIHRCPICCEEFTGDCRVFRSDHCDKSHIMHSFCLSRYISNKSYYFPLKCIFRDCPNNIMERLEDELADFMHSNLNNI